MNRIFTSFLVLFLPIFLAGQSVDVPEVQYSMVTKKTATWCSNCGSWGWDLFKKTVDQNEGKALLWAAHASSSSSLHNPVAAAIGGNFSGVGQPKFYFNTELISAGSSTVNAAAADIKSRVDAANQESPLAQSGLAATHDGTEVHVNTTTRFFENGDGDFYLGIYFIEKAVFANQAGQGDVDHPYILRGSATETILAGDAGFGVQLANTSSGSLNDVNFSFPVTDYDLANLQLATVIWKKDGAKYEFVNANWTDQFDFASSAKAPKAAQLQLSVAPSPVISSAITTFELSKASETSLSLFDLTGKKVAQVFDGKLPSGKHEFDLNRTTVHASGLYLLHLQTEEGVLTRRVVFR